ncbi:hypothetical protein BU26DRAFT_307488 [Trematosphaeria pertusa]|uniref:Uncharacterized protein n=1 Tax=Trematosphaeria pertusa TaxID=390896 RepID=A0A6A6IE27_9PLEO|nr:uncharacterized protein BU26DRAFT_307488 [Trematosphaeria pertusa]KAF2248834.1 hypothetical protein BU26DRAFT_307488 [Trematosphaeria pertusa]
MRGSVRRNWMPAQYSRLPIFSKAWHEHMYKPRTSGPPLCNRMRRAHCSTNQRRGSGKAVTRHARNVEIPNSAGILSQYKVSKGTDRTEICREALRRIVQPECGWKITILMAAASLTLGSFRCKTISKNGLRVLIGKECLGLLRDKSYLIPMSCAFL